MTFLLDVNIAIAVIDEKHVDHVVALDWFEREGRHDWATCPIVQNGVVRIIGNPRYANSLGSPSAVTSHLREWTQSPANSFWADDISILGGGLIDPKRILTHKQVTDTYLLALAVKNGGRLATMDRRLSADAVTGGKAALLII